MIKLTTVNSNLHDVSCDVVCCPTNAYLDLSASIQKLFSPAFLEELQIEIHGFLRGRALPYTVPGSVFISDLKFNESNVLAVASCDRYGTACYDTTRRCLRYILTCVDASTCKRIAIPRFGCEWGLDEEFFWQAVEDEISEQPESSLELVVANVHPIEDNGM